MSIACDWFVLCEQVLCDRQNSNLTLLNCLDRVSAFTFPADHARFAFAARFRWTGAEPANGAMVHYQVVRYSAQDAEEVVSSLHGAWAVGALRSRTYVNFHLLRLRRPETIWFRIDWRMDGGEWVRGPSVPIEVAQMEMTAEMREQLAKLALERESEGEEAGSPGG